MDGDARLTMGLHGSPNTGYSVKCSFCGEGIFDGLESTYGKTRFRSHADLVSRRFSIGDFVDEEGFNEEWERQRGRLNPEAEEAIARAYLSDHIAPMRADIEEMAGISGDPILRYRLDTASPEKRRATTNNRS